jgi:hypothetical protein
MAKERARITFEVDPKLSAVLAGWAEEEGRTLSNLVRRLLSGIADKRMAAQETAARRPSQKQLSA